jgi:hypothetical protein
LLTASGKPANGHAPSAFSSANLTFLYFHCSSAILTNGGKNHLTTLLLWQQQTSNASRSPLLLAVWHLLIAFWPWGMGSFVKMNSPLGNLPV